LKPFPHSRKGRLGLLFLLLVLVVYADPLFLRKNFAGRDLLGYNLPVEAAVHDAYARGRLPLWVSEISGGRPLLPNPNTGSLYPIRPLLACLPFPVAFRLYPILHWVIAGLGVLLLAGTLPCSAAGGWIAAVTYAFSGIGVSEVFYTNYQPGMVLLPWVLWSVAREAAPSRKAILVAFLLGLDFLAGDVFTIGLALGSSILWILTETPNAERRAAFFWLLASVALGLLLAAPQWIATLLWAPQTNRGVLGMKLRDALGFSVSPFRLLEFLIPFPFGPTWALEPGASWGYSIFRGKSVGFFSSFYCGAFAAVSLVTVWRLRSKGLHFARALFVLAITVTILPSFLPEAWGDRPSPLPLRYPEKFCVAFALVLAISTAVALDHWRGRKASSRWTLGIGAGLALLALLCFLFPLPAGQIAVAITATSSRHAGAAGRSLAPALAEAGLAWMATVIAMRGLGRSGIAFALAIGLLSLVPIAANRRIARTFRQEEVFAQTAFVRFLNRADPVRAYRALGVLPEPKTEASYLARDLANLEYSRRTWIQYTPVLWHRGAVFNQDLDVGDLSRMESLRRLAWLALASRESSPFFSGLALRWETRIRGQTAPAGYRRVGGDGMQDWDELPGAYPDIRLLERWTEENDARKIVGEIPRLSPGEVVLETDAARSAMARPGKVKVLEKSPERLVLETICPDPTWLFVLRGYWDYRRVLVDGRPAEPVPAQIAFSAVAIPAGQHRVQWQELLPGERTSRWGPVLFILLSLFLAQRGSRQAGSERVS
jgi:hypothetical protein